MRSASIIAILFLLLSCDTEVSLVGSGDPVPVVYGIFDAADSVHSVKVMKSFSGEASASDLVKQDLLFYDSLDVSLRNVTNRDSIEFHMVHVTDKQDGFFPDSPNLIYQHKSKLTPGKYELIISGNELESDIIQQFALFADMELIYPSPLSRRIYFYDDPVSFTFQPSTFALAYELAFTLEFEEANRSGIENKSVTYSRNISIEELEISGGRMTFRLYSDPFFALISRSVNESPDVTYRKPINLIVKLTAADEELYRFISQLDPDTPIATTYTGNIESGIGIIASKYSITLKNKRLSPKAMDSLRSGRFTKNLKFIANPDW